jgi:ATP-dependent Clp protease protease subunit
VVPLASEPVTQSPSTPPITAADLSTLNPTSEIFNRLLRDRIIILGSDVTDDIASIICAQMLFLEGEDDAKDIWLYINSPGGSVTAGMAIYDTMQFVAPDVATICMGLAASMGQFLLAAGAPGKRFALPHARIMMHQPSGGVRGQASDIAIQAEQLIYIKRLMAERTAHHTGQTVEQVQEDSERDRWFTAEQAKDYGIIDHVREKRSDVATAS